MDIPEGMHDIERLQDLVAGMDDIKDLLDGMTGLAATALTRLTGARIECSMTLHRRERPATIAGSSDQAILLDGIEQRIGDGPCLQALRTGVPVLMQELSADMRWPTFRSELTSRGFGSVLGVPLKLGTTASAGLSLQKSSKMLNFSERSPAGHCDWASESLPLNSGPKTSPRPWTTGPPSTWPAASLWPKTAARERKHSTYSAAPPPPATKSSTISPSKWSPISPERPERPEPQPAELDRMPDPLRHPPGHANFRFNVDGHHR
jgi:hypothetical protein